MYERNIQADDTLPSWHKASEAEVKEVVNNLSLLMEGL